MRYRLDRGRRHCHRQRAGLRLSRLGPRDPRLLGVMPRRSVTDLLWVANTRHGPGGHWFARVVRDEGDHDHLASGPNTVRYLADHHVVLPADEITEGQLTSLGVLRDMVRGLLDPEAGWTPAARAILDETRFRVDEEWPACRRWVRLGCLHRRLDGTLDPGRRASRPPPDLWQSALSPGVPRPFEEPGSALVRQRGLRQSRSRSTPSVAGGCGGLRRFRA